MGEVEWVGEGWDGMPWDGMSWDAVGREGRGGGRQGEDGRVGDVIGGWLGRGSVGAGVVCDSSGGGDGGGTGWRWWWDRAAGAGACAVDGPFVVEILYSEASHLGHYLVVPRDALHLAPQIGQQHLPNWARSDRDSKHSILSSARSHQTQHLRWHGAAAPAAVPKRVGDLSSHL